MKPEETEAIRDDAPDEDENIRDRSDDTLLAELPIVAINDSLLSSASFHRGLAMGYRNAVVDMSAILMSFTSMLLIAYFWWRTNTE